MGAPANPQRCIFTTVAINRRGERRGGGLTPSTFIVACLPVDPYAPASFPIAAWCANPLAPLPAPATQLCPDAFSTVAQTRCLETALKASDRQLDQALTRVAQEARQVPGATYKTLWRESLTNFYRTSTDPLMQEEAFRANRRAVCADAMSVGFQGTGYGSSILRCELALTLTLLDKLKP